MDEQVTLSEPGWFRRYCGMSYEQCSREAARLIEEMNRNGAWYDGVERLIMLRGQMRLHEARATLNG